MGDGRTDKERRRAGGDERRDEHRKVTASVVVDHHADHPPRGEAGPAELHGHLCEHLSTCWLAAAMGSIHRDCSCKP